MPTSFLRSKEGSTADVRGGGAWTLRFSRAQALRLKRLVLQLIAAEFISSCLLNDWDHHQGSLAATLGPW